MDTNLQPVKSRYFSKKMLYSLIKVIIFLIILIICFEVVYNLTKRKYAYEKTADFFSQEENFDVLFFGSSHMMNGVFPMQLWNDYGIVAYNMGNPSESISTTYYNMLLSQEHTNSELIVIDGWSTIFNEKIIMDEEHIHNSLDAYPISYTKYLAVKNIFDEKNILEREVEFLFNFSLYHSRWDELIEDDFISGKKYEKGAESRISVATPNRTSDFNDINIYNEEETINMLYLKKIIEYCKENDIEVLVTYLPYPAGDISIKVSKYLQIICDEYDVNYINFLSMDVVDYNTDCYDEDSHLNPSGARKVTDYLGKYIMENYDIPDQRENEAYSFLYKDYDEYIDLKIENLEKNKKNSNNYLMLLYDEEDIKYEIKISSSREINEGTILYELLKNLDNNYSIDDSAFEENKNKTIKITTYDNRTGEEIDTVWF